jgi:hypothetical protein
MWKSSAFALAFYVDWLEPISQFQSRLEKLSRHGLLRSTEKEWDPNISRNGGEINLSHILEIDQQHVLAHFASSASSLSRRVLLPLSPQR